MASSKTSMSRIPPDAPDVISPHDDYNLSADIPVQCFLPFILSSESPSEDTPSSVATDSTSLKLTKPKRLQHWPMTRGALKAVLVGILALMQSLQWWFTATNAIRFACHLSGAHNSNTTALGHFCKAVIDSRNRMYGQNVDGHLGYFQAEQGVQCNRRLDAQEMSLHRVNGYLGLDVEVDHDVALRGTGAAIISEFTSPTMGQHRSRFSWFRASPSSPSPQSNLVLPGVVLEETVILGECWEFHGQHGAIGIRLPTLTNITALSVHYIPANRLSPHAKQRAPRSLTLWGLIPSSQLRNISSNSMKTRAAKEFAVQSRLPTGIGKGDAFLPVLRANYDLNLNPRHIVFVEAGEQNGVAQQFLYDTVIVETTDNWGANTTCLYHLGIHGIV